jgi:hypothetical protein
MRQVVQRASSTPPDWPAACFEARCPAASTLILTAEPDEEGITAEYLVPAIVLLNVKLKASLCLI